MQNTVLAATLSCLATTTALAANSIATTYNAHHVRCIVQDAIPRTYSCHIGSAAILDGHIITRSEFNDIMGDWCDIPDGNDPDEAIAIISRIKVYPSLRLQGMGSALLYAHSVVATDNNVAVTFLEPVPSGGITIEDLLRFYQRNRFTCVVSETALSFCYRKE